MAKTKSKTKAQERKKLGNKASQIRHRLKYGKNVKPEQLAWLAEWDAGKDPKAAASGNARKGANPAPQAPKTPKANAESVEPVKPTGRPPGVPESAPAAPAELPKASPPKADAADGIPSTPKPPPGPLPKDAPAMGGADWRKKYFGATESREEQCQFVAGYWLKGLLRMNADIRELGGTPIVPDGLAIEMLLPAMVLTVDKFAPDDLDVDPVVVSAIGSSVITGQRVYQGRTAAAKKKRDERKDADVLKFVQPPPKASEPAEPKPEDIPRKEPEVDGVKDDHEIQPGDYA